MHIITKIGAQINQKQWNLIRKKGLLGPKSVTNLQIFAEQRGSAGAEGFLKEEEKLLRSFLRGGRFSARETLMFDCVNF